MPTPPLLVNIALAVVYALVGGLVARALRLPTIVGYLLAGVALGPFTPGVRGDVDAIRQLAELGVILLMFGVGLHFSLRDLWLVRHLAVPGALLQTTCAAALGYWLARRWGWSTDAALVLGISISVASTVVFLRGLIDTGAVQTPDARVAIGWLVMEDLATIAILVLLPPLLSPERAEGWVANAVGIGTSLVFLAVMLSIGKRVLPAILRTIANAQSRELFVLVVLTLAVGTAMASAHMFGVSLALGAFVAGVVVSESPYSYQVSADLLPFRETFAVLFFVSVGMLVNPEYLITNWRQVAALAALIVVGKSTLGGLIGIALRCPARTSLVVAAGLSQIGEFSFIVGQTGVALGVLDEAQYSLILAAAIVSITINPWMFRLTGSVERLLRRRPRLWARLNGQRLEITNPAQTFTDHVVIVGCGRVGRHVVEVLGRIGVSRIVVDTDVNCTGRMRALGIPLVFGDAATPEILNRAALEWARTLVITVSDDPVAETIVAAARRSARSIHIITRAATAEGARRLKKAGAYDIVEPELEGAIEIVRRTLLDLQFPAHDVLRYADAVRKEGLDAMDIRDDRVRVLSDLAHAARSLEIRWYVISDASPVAGLTLAESELRTRTGATIVAINRGEDVLSNPEPAERLNPGDRVAVIGAPEAIARAERLLTNSSKVSDCSEPFYRSS